MVTYRKNGFTICLDIDCVNELTVNIDGTDTITRFAVHITDKMAVVGNIHNGGGFSVSDGYTADSNITFAENIWIDGFSGVRIYTNPGNYTFLTVQLACQLFLTVSMYDSNIIDAIIIHKTKGWKK